MLDRDCYSSESSIFTFSIHSNASWFQRRRKAKEDVWSPADFRRSAVLLDTGSGGGRGGAGQTVERKLSQMSQRKAVPPIFQEKDGAYLPPPPAALVEYGGYGGYDGYEGGAIAAQTATESTESYPAYSAYSQAQFDRYHPLSPARSRTQSDANASIHTIPNPFIDPTRPSMENISSTSDMGHSTDIHSHFGLEFPQPPQADYAPVTRFSPATASRSLPMTRVSPAPMVPSLVLSDSAGVSSAYSSPVTPRGPGINHGHTYSGSNSSRGLPSPALPSRGTPVSAKRFSAVPSPVMRSPPTSVGHQAVGSLGGSNGNAKPLPPSPPSPVPYPVLTGKGLVVVNPDQDDDIPRHRKGEERPATLYDEGDAYGGTA